MVANKLSQSSFIVLVPNIKGHKKRKKMDIPNQITVQIPFQDDSTKILRQFRYLVLIILGLVIWSNILIAWTLQQSSTLTSLLIPLCFHIFITGSYLTVVLQKKFLALLSQYAREYPEKILSIYVCVDSHSPRHHFDLCIDLVSPELRSLFS